MTKHVTIIGGGWSGLAAAVELSKNNIPVTVYESAKQLGGRARSVKTNNFTVDNGQHLMIGAYQQMLDLLKTINVIEEDVFYRTAQQIKIISLKTNETAFYLKLPKVPAPLNLLLGILRCPSLSFTEQIQTLYRFNKLLNKKIIQDLNVDLWLDKARLPSRYIDKLLKPLCLAALTTHTHDASAKVFQAVLQKTFNGPQENTDLLIAKKDLNNIFPEAAKNYIESKGGKIFLEHRTSQINIANHKASSVIINGKTIDVDQLILATPSFTTSKLLSAIKPCNSICNKLNQFEYEPVTTVYLQYPENISLPIPMLGMIDSTSEWVFDRQYCKQPGVIACVISATGPHLEMNNQALTQKVEQELKKIFPHWPEAKSSIVICEKRASLRCSPDIDSIRPKINTPISNIKLCGDYVHIEEKNHSGLPSTLEGALQSGVKCAQFTIQDIT